MSDDEIVIPALLRAARGAYGAAIREKLAECGCSDLPANGPFVIGGMANHGAPAAAMLGGLDISRNAGYQLIDVLVARNYLERVPDAEDPVRTRIELTARGRAAGQAIAAGIAEVDAELARRLSAEELAGFRAGLGNLALLAERGRRSREQR